MRNSKWKVTSSPCPFLIFSFISHLISFCESVTVVLCVVLCVMCCCWLSCCVVCVVLCPLTTHHNTTQHNNTRHHPPTVIKHEKWNTTVQRTVFVHVTFHDGFPPQISLLAHVRQFLPQTSCHQARERPGVIQSPHSRTRTRCLGRPHRRQTSTLPTYTPPALSVLCSGRNHSCARRSINFSPQRSPVNCG